MRPWHRVRISDRASAYSDLQTIYNLVYADLSRFEHHDFSALRAYVNPATYDPIITSGPQRHSPLLNHENILMSSICIFGIILEFFNNGFKLKWKDKILELTQKFVALTRLNH